MKMYWMISVRDSLFVPECRWLNLQERVHCWSLLKGPTVGLKRAKEKKIVTYQNVCKHTFLPSLE